MEFFVFVVNSDLNKEFNKKCQIAERKEHNVNEDSYTSGDMFVYILSLFDFGHSFPDHNKNLYWLHYTL